MKRENIVGLIAIVAIAAAVIEKVLKYLNDYLLPDESIELSLRGGWGVEEAIPQFKIPTKRTPNRVLYQKISIHFRKISDYGTNSLLRGGVDGAN